MNYYQECEKVGDELFTSWANKVGCFTEMERQDLYSRCDWICKTSKGLVVNCELKVRDSLNWPDILIEPGKYNYLIQKWEKEKIIPWYINLCDDLVYVFDLRKCKVIDKGMMRIWSKPDKCYKFVHRFALLTSDAYKFKNGVQIKRNINK